MFARPAILFALVLFGAISYSKQAFALEDFLLCGTCNAQWQFEETAKAHVPGLPGNYQYAVGNPNTYELRYVTVSVSLYPNEPESMPIGLASETYGESTEEYPPTIASTSEVFLQSQGSISASSYRATTAQEQQFGALVELSRDSNIGSPRLMLLHLLPFNSDSK